MNVLSEFSYLHSESTKKYRTKYKVTEGYYPGEVKNETNIYIQRKT